MSDYSRHPNRIARNTGEVALTGQRLSRIERALWGISSRSLNIQHNGESIAIDLLDANAQTAASVSWVRLTGLHADSPASGVRVYTGSLLSGPQADATATATVTIMVPDIAADWTAPASGLWSDLPRFAASPHTATWTGAGATHTETVYYLLDPFRWY